MRVETPNYFPKNALNILLKTPPNVNITLLA